MTAEHESQSPRAEDATPHSKRSLWRRAGCGFILVLWFGLLLSPCALLYLAANGEIRLWHREIPESHAHPLLLISLISGADDRGVRMESSSIASETADGDAICVETTVRFLLWQSSSASQDARYCDCYGRATIDAPWRLDNFYAGGCRAQE